MKVGLPAATFVEALLYSTDIDQAIIDGMRMHRFFVCVILIFLCETSGAQSSEVGQFEFSYSYGPLMTGTVYAATESIMISSARLGYNFENWRPMLHYATGKNSLDETVKIMGIGLKKPITFVDLGGFNPFFQFGVQTSTFSPPDYKNSGFNLGFGLDILLSRAVQLRTDFNYNNEGILKYLTLTMGLQLVF